LQALARVFTPHALGNGESFQNRHNIQCYELWAVSTSLLANALSARKSTKWELAGFEVSCAGGC